jgi:hypothetical protein
MAFSGGFWCELVRICYSRFPPEMTARKATALKEAPDSILHELRVIPGKVCSRLS